MRSLHLLGLAALLASFAGEGRPPAEVHVAVIVNIANPVTALPRTQIARIFLRTVVSWDSGLDILPVDQIDKSPARAGFAHDVMHQSVNALKRYWQERIFSGNESPPPDRVTDAEVLTYVRSNPGAIGYVVAGAELGAGVKTITVVDDDR